jgi:CubicO group peptidase (beta-lactamase class C family)
MKIYHITILIISWIFASCGNSEKSYQPKQHLTPVWTDNLLQEIQATGQDTMDSDIVKKICDLPLSILKTPRLFSIASIRDENLAQSYAQMMIAPIQMCDIDVNLLAVDDNLDIAFKKEFFGQTLTLPSNPKKIIPIRAASNIQIVHIGRAKRDDFDHKIGGYTSINKIEHLLEPELFISEPLEQKKVVIVTLTDKITYNGLYQELALLNKKTKLIIVNFGNIDNLKKLSKAFTIVQVYEQNEITEDICAQLIFGARNATGQLPIDVSNDFKYGQGDNKTPVIRFQYASAYEVGINGNELETNIDKIMARAIRKKATPGGRVLIVKSGNIILNKSYGFHTYDKVQKVKDNDVYDIASITKVAATTLAVMRLYEQGKIDDVEDYWEKYFGTKTEKGETSRIHNLRLRYLLTHRSGLPSSAPIVQYVRVKDQLSDEFLDYFSNKKTGDYSVKITDDLYLKKQLHEEMWNDIQRTRRSSSRSFKYSDVNFLILQRLVEHLTKQPLDEYVTKEFYKPLQLNSLVYNPLGKIKSERIVPTEFDKKWRNQQLKGQVQDETAAFLGGVGGHAGLFSSAEDLATIGQMLLNGGEYGGTRLFKKETIDFFTSTKHGNHRGLGFDVKSKKGAAGCYYGAGKGTFGHSGYTGTSLWVDPANDLVYVFLSNRVYTDKKNDRLMKYKTREMVHRAIYKAMD